MKREAEKDQGAKVLGKDLNPQCHKTNLATNYGRNLIVNLNRTQGEIRWCKNIRIY